MTLNKLFKILIVFTTHYSYYLAAAAAEVIINFYIMHIIYYYVILRVHTEALRPVKHEALVFSSFNRASISSTVLGRPRNA